MQAPCSVHLLAPPSRPPSLPGLGGPPMGRPACPAACCPAHQRCRAWVSRCTGCTTRSQRCTSGPGPAQGCVWGVVGCGGGAWVCGGGPASSHRCAAGLSMCRRCIVRQRAADMVAHTTAKCTGQNRCNRTCRQACANVSLKMLRQPRRVTPTVPAAALPAKSVPRTRTTPTHTPAFYLWHVVPDGMGRWYRQLRLATVVRALDLQDAATRARQRPRPTHGRGMLPACGAGTCAASVRAAAEVVAACCACCACRRRCIERQRLNQPIW